MGTTKTAPGEFSVSAEKYRLVVKAQRELLDAIARRVERGEPVARTDERNLIAGILRAWAGRMPETLPDAGRGAARMDPAYVAIHFAVLVNFEGQDRAAAAAELAQIYEVSPEVIAEAIAKFEGAAMRLVPKNPG
jgi:class 3 adenylate cyclase